MCVCIDCFGFFKQKTAYEMRISDWSSDVCSSDHRGDALLEFGDLAGKRRLVADAGGQPAEQARDLAARLDQAIDVVDQKQDVLVGFVTEMLGDGERRQTRPPTRARWLIHLPEAQRGAFEHNRLPGLQQQPDRTSGVWGKRGAG